MCGASRLSYLWSKPFLLEWGLSIKAIEGCLVNWRGKYNECVILLTTAIFARFLRSLGTIYHIWVVDNRSLTDYTRVGSLWRSLMILIVLNLWRSKVSIYTSIVLADTFISRFLIYLVQFPRSIICGLFFER